MHGFCWLQDQDQVSNILKPGWWFQPLWKILVNGKDYPIYYGKKCLKPPTRNPFKHKSAVARFQIPCWSHSSAFPQPSSHTAAEVKVCQGTSKYGNLISEKYPLESYGISSFSIANDYGPWIIPWTKWSIFHVTNVWRETQLSLESRSISSSCFGGCNLLNKSGICL